MTISDERQTPGTFGHPIHVQIVHRTTLRVLVTATLYAIALALVYFAYPALIAIIFSFFLAYLLEPVMNFVERHVWRSRLGAIALSYIFLFILITGFAVLVGGKIERDLGTVNQRVPIFWNEIKSGRSPAALEKQSGVIAKLGHVFVHSISGSRSWIEQFAQHTAHYASDIAAVIFLAVVVLILGIFVLKDKDRWITNVTHEPEDPGKRRRLHSMLMEIDRSLARYIWSLAILSAIAFGVFALVLSALRVPSAILLAALEGLLEWIFVFGPLTAGIIIMAAAIFGGHSLWPVLVFLIAWRIVQDYINTPMLFGKRLEMHPLAIVVILMIGWSMGKIVGMFLAVPIAAVGQIAWETWSTHRSPGKDVAALFEQRKAA